jgi:amylosucrase
MPETAITDDYLFALRWDRGRRDLTGPILRLYGDEIDADTFLDRLKSQLHSHGADRPTDLKPLDLYRDLNPDWFLSQNMTGCAPDIVGGVITVPPYACLRLH